MQNKKLLYNSLKEWKKANPNAYAAAKKFGLIEKICSKFDWECKIRVKWTKEMCFEEAKKYKVKEHWKKNSLSSYACARRKGWYEDLIAHMIDGCTPKNFWTKEKCLEEALKHNCKTDFMRSEKGAYSAADKNGWLDEICSHMPKHSSKKNKTT